MALSLNKLNIMNSSSQDIDGKWKVNLRPTVQGLLYAFVLLFMLWASVNYKNNLAYVFLFMLASLGITSILHAWRNLSYVEIKPATVEPTFAGEPVELQLRLQNDGSVRCENIQIYPGSLGLEPRQRIVEALPSGGSLLHSITLADTTRGLHQIKGVSLTSTFPLGIVKVARTYSVIIEYMVFPKPEGDLPWPALSTAEHSDEGGKLLGGDDYAGHHEWHEGESQRRIDWKAYARGKGLLVKEYTGGGTGRACFDFHSLPDIPLEVKLSQLSRWIVDANYEGLSYALRMPKEQIGPDIGKDHFYRCLRSLALYHSSKGETL